MGFKEAVRTTVKEKYATFKGRASRSEYWFFQLFYWAVMMVMGLAYLAFGGANVTSEPSVMDFIIFIPGAIYGLAMLFPALGVQVRRFHDRNMSGWWYLLLVVAGIIPFVGFLSTLAIFVISALPGTIGPNKFGSDPLRPEASAEVFA